MYSSFVVVVAGLTLGLSVGRDGTVPATVAVEDPPLYPLKDIKAGQVAKGYTVFASSRGPEPFSAEILGVMHGYLGPGEDLIIARLVGEQIERTGVISGMSGSPVYIDGKLVGAVGYGFGQFTKDAIAGITPIERMMTGAVAPTPVVRSASSSRPTFSETPWGRAEPIAVPIMVSGLAPGVSEGLREVLEARGYGPLMAAGSSSSSSSSVATSTSAAASSSPKRFYASGPIAGLMVSGDTKMAGIGTVTWVKGDRFLGFGHPFMGTGPSAMVVANAEIVTTVASEAGSWKMGQATALVGRLTDDRLHAIGGTIGELPALLPVDLSVDLPSVRKGADALSKYHFDVMDHPTDTPLFSAIAIANALQGRVTAETGGTFDVTVDVTLKSGERVVLPARLADDQASPAIPTALAVLGVLTQITDSDFQEVSLASVKVNVRGRRAVEQSRVAAVSMVGGAKAGDDVTVAVRLQPWRAPMVERALRFRVPRGLPPGSYAVVVASDGNVSRVEREGGLIPTPRSLGDELALLSSRAPPGSLSVYIVRDEASPRLDGAALPGLPGSLRDLTAGSGGYLGSGAYESRATRVARQVIGPGVVIGEASTRLEVLE